MRRYLNNGTIIEPHHFGLTPLHAVSECYDIDTSEHIGLLLNHNADVNTRDLSGLTPLYMAVSHGHINSIKTLLENGASYTLKDRRLMSPINTAIIDGNACALQLLLDYGVSVNVKDRSGYYPIHIAMMSEINNGLLQLLLDYGASVNVKERTSGCTPLHMAISMENYEYITILLKNLQKIDLNCLTMSYVTIIL